MSCQPTPSSLFTSQSKYHVISSPNEKSIGAHPSLHHGIPTKIPRKMCAIQFVSPFSGLRCLSPAIESPWVPGWSAVRASSPGISIFAEKKIQQDTCYLASCWILLWQVSIPVTVKWSSLLHFKNHSSPYPWNQQLTPEASIKGDQSSTINLGVCPKHIF